VRRLLLARHGHARSNELDVVSSLPPGEGLSETGVAQALELRRHLADERVDFGLSSRLERSRRTLELALAERPVERGVEPLLDEISFGAYEGGPLAAYREWAWSTPPEIDPPGEGESRVALALRVAQALGSVLERREEVVLVVWHALPLRYALDAASGVEPRARMTPVPHAQAFALEQTDAARAVDALRRWAAAPRFADS
jgi:broad specificity phosphatase PhoE